MTSPNLDFLIDQISRRGFDGVIGELEQQIVMRALERTEGNRNQAAILLKLNRTTLVEKLKKWGLRDFFRVERVL